MANNEKLAIGIKDEDNVLYRFIPPAASDSNVGGIKASPKTTQTQEVKIDPTTNRLYVDDPTDDIANVTGNLTNLHTTNKQNLVGAINEVNDAQTNIKRRLDKENSDTKESINSVGELNCFNILRVFCNYSTVTTNGVEYKWDGDTCTVNGTSTGVASCNLFFNENVIPASIKIGKTYRVINEQNSSSVGVRIGVHNGTSWTWTDIARNKETEFTFPENTHGVAIRLWISSAGTTVNNYKVKFVVISGATNSEIINMINSSEDKSKCTEYKLAELAKLNCSDILQLFGNFSEVTKNGITYKWDGDTCTVNGVSTGISINDLYYNESSLPSSIEKGKTYRVINEQETGLVGARIGIFNGLTWDWTEITRNQETMFVVPDNAVGMIVRLQVGSAEVAANNHKVRFRIINSRTNAELEKDVSATKNDLYTIYSDYELGTFNGTTGVNGTSTTRIRTKHLIDVQAISTIRIRISGQYTLGAYDQYLNFLGSTGFISNELTRNSITELYPDVKYVKIAYKRANNSECDVDDYITYGMDIVICRHPIENWVANTSGKYYGEKIVIKENPISYEKKFKLSLLGGGQGGAIYNNKLVWGNSAGAVNIRDIVTGEEKTVSIGNSTTSPHMNVVFFEKNIRSGLSYPYLYTNAYNNLNLPKGTCYAYSISDDLNLTLEQTISIGFTDDEIWTDGDSDIRPYGNFIMNTDTGALWVYTLLDTHNVTRFFRFKKPSATETSIILNKSDIVETFDVPYFNTIQDNCYFNNKIYILSGSSNNAYLHVIDLTQRTEVSTVNLSEIGWRFEPEMIDIYNGHLFIGNAEKELYEFFV